MGSSSSASSIRRIGDYHVVPADECLDEAHTFGRIMAKKPSAYVVTMRLPVELLADSVEEFELETLPGMIVLLEQGVTHSLPAPG